MLVLWRLFTVFWSHIGNFSSKHSFRLNIYNTWVISKGPLTIYENIDWTNKWAIQIATRQNALPKFKNEGCGLFTNHCKNKLLFSWQHSLKCAVYSVVNRKECNLLSQARQNEIHWAGRKRFVYFITKKINGQTVLPEVVFDPIPVNLEVMWARIRIWRFGSLTLRYPHVFSL